MLLQLRDIEKKYGNEKRNFTVLKGVHLEIDLGEFVAITGRSGAGKSTLLNIVAGLEVPSKGSIVFCGKEIDYSNAKIRTAYRRNNIGVIMQNFALINHISVYENVYLPCRYSNLPKNIRKAKVIDLLQWAGLEDLQDKYPFELSGGECQRVAICRALILDPKIILADEPTGSLDSEMEQTTLSLLKQLNSSGATILLVTHNQSIASICSRMITIVDGKTFEGKGD